MRKPLIVAVDGRSGAGKTTLAVELAATLRAHRTVSLFHLEDLYPGWEGLEAGITKYVESVLTPLRSGRAARWRAWDWGAGHEGEERVTEAAEIIVVEGVGAGANAARELLDAVVWVEAPEDERKRRALERDGDSYAPFWNLWAGQEERWLAADGVPEAAQLLLRTDGTPRPGEAVAQDVIAALAQLPSWRLALAPERSVAAGTALLERTLPARPAPDVLFAALYGFAEQERDAGAQSDAVWLDSSSIAPEGDPRARFSIMGDGGGRLGRSIRHERGRNAFRAGSVVAHFEEPFFRWLDTAWAGEAAESRAPGGSARDPGLPESSGFSLGWLGYLGYELKRECGGSDIDPGVPDAELLFAARAVVIDHALGEVRLLALEAPDASGWLDAAEQAVRDACAPLPPVSPRTPPSAPVFQARDRAETYRRKVRAAQAEIAEGESYEVCLTTTLAADDVAIDPWDAYLALRRRSPAPFAAFLRFSGLSIASSSPERFLRIDADGALRAEPIKGTRPRAADPTEDAAVASELAANPKDRAENLMIVDLLRNDLSRFAEPGSVSVSRLFAVESYATVHQLVSTIDARLRPRASRAEAVAAAFPPGSMTGAPKISTMDILDQLEGSARGIYSGALGYFSRDGAADLSVVIRTLVFRESLRGGRPPGEGQAAAGGRRVSLGVGGAVVADSDPEGEYQEIRTKAFGALSTLGSHFPDD